MNTLENLNDEIFNIVQKLLIGIPTIYKIFLPSRSCEVVELALNGLKKLETYLSTQAYLVLKTKLYLLLFGIWDGKQMRSLKKLLEVLNELKELRKKLQNETKLESLKAELYFAEAYFIYRLKKNKYGSLENLAIPEEERRYTWALKLLGQSFELLGDSEKFQLTRGRISLLQSKIYTIVKEKENIPLLTLEKNLKTAIESFENVPNLKRMEYLV